MSKAVDMWMAQGRRRGNRDGARAWSRFEAVSDKKRSMEYSAPDRPHPLHTLSTIFTALLVISPLSTAPLLHRHTPKSMPPHAARNSPGRVGSSSSSIAATRQSHHSQSPPKATCTNSQAAVSVYAPTVPLQPTHRRRQRPNQGPDKEDTVISAPLAVVTSNRVRR